MLQELLRVLINRTMAGVRVDNQFGVGQVLLQGEVVDRIEHDVMAASDHEHRLLDCLKVLIGVFLRGTPGGNRR